MSGEQHKCRGGTRTHNDAEKLVEYLIDRGGVTTQPNESIAMDLGWVVNLGGGNRRIDLSRLIQARRHVQTGVVGGKPCTGYSLHYRKAGRKAGELRLVDPTGSLGETVRTVIATLLGWATREAQHHTENQRMIGVVDRLADHCMAVHDPVGYRLMMRASVALDTDGTIPSPLLAEINVWLSTLP